MTKEPKSIRLNQHVREKIVEELLENAFKKEADSLKKRRQAFSTKVYNDIYSKAQRDTMNSLPEGWLPVSQNFRVQFGSNSSDVCERQLKDQTRFPYSHARGYQVLKVYDNQHKFTAEHEKLTDEDSDLKARHRTARAQSEAIVAAANSTKQLKAAWPKIAKIVEKYEPKDANETTAIALVPDEINKLFKL